MPLVLMTAVSLPVAQIPIPPSVVLACLVLLVMEEAAQVNDLSGNFF